MASGLLHRSRSLLFSSCRMSTDDGGTAPRIGAPWRRCSALMPSPFDLGCVRFDKSFLFEGSVQTFHQITRPSFGLVAGLDGETKDVSERRRRAGLGSALPVSRAAICPHQWHPVATENPLGGDPPGRVVILEACGREKPSS